MADRQFANAVSTTLSSGMTNVQTTMTVASATGFPTTFPFDVHIEAETTNTDEILSVTSLSSGTTYNVTRASEPYAGSASASAHASGAVVRLVVTAAALAALALEVKETDGAPDVTGVTVVQLPPGGLTDNTGGNVTLDLVPNRNGSPVGTQTIAASGAAQTLDLSAYSAFDITLTANCTLTYSNPPPSGSLAGWLLIIRQGGTGSYTLTYPAAQKWKAADGTLTGSAPTLYTAVGAEDDILIETVDGGTTYGGRRDFSAAGTVTSVALTMPAEFAVAGSPVTASGTLAVTKANESANTVYAGPTSGGAAAPAFRALVAADIPAGVAGATDHEHIMHVQFTGDGSTAAFELPAAPFDAYSVDAFDAGTWTDVTLSGYLLTTMTFGSAPTAGHLIDVSIVAAVA